MMARKASLLWMDLEMTGLDPTKDKILEVACIATDWKMQEMASYKAAVKCEKNIMEQRMVGEFWQKNAKVRKELISQSIEAKDVLSVEKELLDFVDKNFGKTLYLAGNSIHQDRKFIEHEWVKLNKRLHYRMLDVSSWKIYFEGAKKKKFMKAEAHRALDDIRGSIEELKWYLKMKF